MQLQDTGSIRDQEQCNEYWDQIYKWFLCSPSYIHNKTPQIHFTFLFCSQYFLHSIYLVSHRVTSHLSKPP